MYKYLLVVGLTFFFISILLTSTFISADELSPTPDISADKLNDVNKKISDLQNRIGELQSKEKSLQTELELISSQIDLTQLRINDTTEQIELLNTDINTTKNKINNLEYRLNKITKALLNRVVATYTQGTLSQMAIFIQAADFNDYFTKMNYLKIIQARDRKILYDTAQTKNDYINQKNIFEEKKLKVIGLQQELEEYRKEIDIEKTTKEELLRTTKNDEIEYQRQLSAAKAEKAAIEGVVSSLKFENGTPVKEGQIIAAVGNTGYPDCSTGPHLHFEIRVNEAVVDPSEYLKSDTKWQYNYPEELFSYYGTINPRGSWQWPLEEVVRVNQAYGTHNLAQHYPGGIHTGIDMESGSVLIHTVRDGVLYSGSTFCGSSALKYVAVDHGNGVVSWYWHVQ